MKSELIPVIGHSLMLAGCSHYDCDQIATEQTQISVDGKIKVELGCNGDALKFKITNVSSEEYVLSGATCINRYAWKLPSLSEIKKVTVGYNVNSWNADILTVIANSTNQSVPENLYQGRIQIDWENKLRLI